MTEYLTASVLPGIDEEPDAIQVNPREVFYLQRRGTGTTIVSPTGYRIAVDEPIETVRDHLQTMNGNYVFGE